jgi:hypothetical protein
MNTSTRASFANADLAHASTAKVPLLRSYGLVMPATTSQTTEPTPLDHMHTVDLSQAEIATILYYLESYFCGSDENPKNDLDLMSVFAKLENLPTFHHSKS